MLAPMRAATLTMSRSSSSVRPVTSETMWAASANNASDPNTIPPMISATISPEH